MKTFQRLMPSAVLFAVYILIARGVLAQTEQEIKDDVSHILKSAQQNVEFYGRVVDQQNAPIGGVQVSVTVLSLKDPTGKGLDFEQQQDSLALKTDANGLFQVTNKTGESLIINSLRKDGYIPAPFKQVEFDYDPEDSNKIHRANPGNPVVFAMWQRQSGKTDLTVWESPMRSLPADGTPVILDVISRIIEPVPKPISGLRLKLEKDAVPTGSAMAPFSWTFTIEAVSGGILPTNDEFLFQAPKTGYIPTHTITVRSDDKDWSNMRTIKCYYVSAGERIFGRIELEISAPRTSGRGSVTVKSAVNMNGSTNLEP